MLKKIHQSVVSNYKPTEHKFTYYYTPKIKIVIEQDYSQHWEGDIFVDDIFCQLIKIIDEKIFEYNLYEIVKEINKVEYLINPNTYRLVELESKDVLNGVCKFSNFKINNDYLYFHDFDSIYCRHLTRVPLDFAKKLADPDNKESYNYKIGDDPFTGMRITKFSNNCFELSALNRTCGVCGNFKCSKLRSVIELYNSYKTYQTLVLSKSHNYLIKKLGNDITNIIMLCLIGYRYKPFDFV